MKNNFFLIASLALAFAFAPSGLSAQSGGSWHASEETVDKTLERPDRVQLS